LLNIIGTIDKLTKVVFMLFRGILTSTTRRSNKALLIKFYQGWGWTISALFFKLSTSSQASQPNKTYSSLWSWRYQLFYSGWFDIEI